MLVLLNRSGKELALLRNSWGAGWQALTVEWEFSTVPGQAEYVLPTDFRELVDGTLWDRSTFREMRGPLSPQGWQALQSGLIETVAIAPYYRLRRSSTGRGRSFWIEPIPGGEDNLVMEYFSTNWAISSSGTRQDRIIQDTDETLFDEELMELSLLWRFRKAKGLDFAVELADFEMRRDRLMSDDAGSRPISVSRQHNQRFRYNVPETGFGAVNQ